MRSLRIAVLAAAVLCAIGMTREAAATVTIELEWGACGGGAGGCTPITPNKMMLNPGGGQTLRLDVFLSHDEPSGIFLYTFSLNFDTDLGNELNLESMAGVEWAGSDIDPSLTVGDFKPLSCCAPTTVESTTGVAGRLNHFESAGYPPSFRRLPVSGAAYSVGTFTATAPARYRVGQVFFSANSVIPDDGADVFSGIFSNPYDQFIDGDTNDIPGSRLSFGTAEILWVPEPATSSLLGLGLVGLVLARRASRPGLGRRCSGNRPGS